MNVLLNLKAREFGKIVEALQFAKIDAPPHDRVIFDKIINEIEKEILMWGDNGLYSPDRDG